MWWYHLEILKCCSQIAGWIELQDHCFIPKFDVDYILWELTETEVGKLEELIH